MRNIKKFEIKKVSFELNSSEKDQFVSCKFYAIAEGQNLNLSNFTIEGMEKSKLTVYNKPILAYYNTKTSDFEGHESDIKIDPDTLEPYYSYVGEHAEKIIGIIPESSSVQVEQYRGKNWLTFDALIFQEYNREIVKLLKNRKVNSVSVEVDVISSHYIEDIEYITEFEFLGVCLLGKSVSEGIPGAKMILSDYIESEEFLKFKKEFSVAYEKLNKGKIMETFIDKEKIGKKPALKIDKSAKAASNSSWGDVNKSALVKAIFEASNWKSAMNDVFMLLESGWEQGVEGSCKYPVMQIKSGTLVYNLGGLASALGYAKKEGVSSVVKKVEAIRKKLGIKEEGEKSVKMNLKDVTKKYNFIFSSENLAFFVSKGKLFAHPLTCEEGAEEEFAEEKLMEAEVKMGLVSADEAFEVSDAFAKIVEEAEDAKKELEEVKADKKEMEDEKKNLEENKAEMEEEKKEFDTVKAEYEEKVAKMEADKKEMEVKLESAKAELEQVAKEYATVKMAGVKAEMKALLEEDDEPDGDEDDVTDDEKKEFAKNIDEGKYATVEEFEKDLAYAKYVKAKMAKGKEKGDKFQYALNNKPAVNTISNDPIEIAAKAVNIKK